MPKKLIKYKSVQFSLPEAAYNSVNLLAQRENKTVNKYIMTLVEREIINQNLPLFCEAESKITD